jgi:hypothetical protein
MMYTHSHAQASRKIRRRMLSDAYLKIEFKDREPIQKQQNRELLGNGSGIRVKFTINVAHG